MATLEEYQQRFKEFGIEANYIAGLLRDSEHLLRTLREDLRDNKKLRDNRRELLIISYNNTLTYDFSEAAGDTLAERAILALEMNPEFDWGFLRIDLLMACKDPNAIRIHARDYTAFEVEVDINMDLVAGDIYEYADAVRSVRENLKMTAADPSYFWRTYIYGTGREGKRAPRRKKKDKKTGEEKKVDETWKYVDLYRKTMYARKSFFASLAPYWEIIDKGTSAMIGKGGTAYPVNKPTNFVNDSRAEIKYMFITLWKMEYQEYLNSINERIYRFEETIRDLEELMEEIRYFDEDKTEIYEEEIINWLEESGRLEYADPEAIKKFAQELALGADPRRVQLGDPRARVRTMIIAERARERILRRE